MPTPRAAVTAVVCCVAGFAAAHSRAVAAELPPTMQAAAIDHAGGPEAVTLHTLPLPQPAADEVLIAVNTAGVGSWDGYLRAHPEAIKHNHFPLVLGTDGAGTVAAVGANVHRLKLGDAVYSYSWDNPNGGFYAEYVAVPAQRVGLAPKGLSLRDTGAIATTGLTALQGIDDALHLKSGDTLIIHGASGGVGTLALQFARLRGVRVLATASGEDGLALVKRLGATAVVDGRKGDIVAAARAFAPSGVDAVLAFAGGDSLERCLDALRYGGRVAFPFGIQPEPKPRDEVGAYIRYNAVPGPAEFEQLNRAIEAAKLEVPIAAEFPLAQAGQAQARVEAGHVLGKVVLRVH
jgi:NADPH:quinone reductase